MPLQWELQELSLQKTKQRIDKAKIGIRYSRKKRLRIEVTEEKKLRLLKEGHVCAMDFRCLDCTSEHCLLRLCLESLRTSSINDGKNSETIVKGRY